MDIKRAVKKYIVDTILMTGEAAAAGITDDTSFLARGIIDSTGVLELVLFLQETFAIEVADHEMVPENLDSLAAIEAYVNRKLAEEPARAVAND